MFSFYSYILLIEDVVVNSELLFSAIIYPYVPDSSKCNFLIQKEDIYTFLQKESAKKR